MWVEPENSLEDQVYTLNATREDSLAYLASQPSFDALIVGGGIHGASFARLAALNGLRVLLVEKGDFGSGTSSRSSKMAHGGLRYLELFDFRQVFEGVKSREWLFKVAPNLVKPHEFFVPIEKGDAWFKRARLKIGLMLYDLFLHQSERKHHWVSSKSLAGYDFPLGFQNKLRGGFLYSDGLMSDIRLVRETILAARQEGALTLNYMSFKQHTVTEEGACLVTVQDEMSSKEFVLPVGFIVNCTGPFVSSLSSLSRSDKQPSLLLSQGSHLVFDKPWRKPALILPLKEKSRYYFVWPYKSYTLVGTTELKMDAPVSDPFPTKAEVREVLDRLEQDLPDFGLDRSTLFYVYSGLRALPLKENRSAASLAKLSRRHIWSLKGNVLSLFGGKFTTANWTAFEGLRHVFRLTDLDQVPHAALDRVLPGSADLVEVRNSFFAFCSSKGVDLGLAESVFERLGARTKLFLEEKLSLESLSGACLKGEIELELEEGQLQNLNDLMRLRLELEITPDYGLSCLPQILEVLKTLRPEWDIEKQEKSYLGRISRLREFLAGV